MSRTHTLLERQLVPGVCVQQVLENVTQGMQVAWSPDGRYLATHDECHTIFLWDQRTEAWLEPIQLDQSFICTLAWAPDSQRLAIAMSTSAMVVWHLTNQCQTHLLEAAYAPFFPTDIAWSPTGDMIAAIQLNGRLLRWDLTTSDVQYTALEGDACYCLAFSPCGSQVAVGTKRGDIVRFNQLDRFDKHYARATGHRGMITHLLWPTPDRLISASGDRTIGLWRVEADHIRLTNQLEGHGSTVTAIAMSPDGRLLASHDDNGSIRLWRLDELASLAHTRPMGINGRRLTMAFHPTQPLLAVIIPRLREIGLVAFDLPTLFGASASDESVRYATTKIVLLGESGVGKSGLGWRLSQGSYKPHDSTHGQQCWLLPQLATTRADGTECEAILWDLAGQPDYRLVHTLFLRDADLALLLFDAADRRDSLHEIPYWCKVLQEANPQIKMILVAARTDRGDCNLTPTELQTFCAQQKIHDTVRTSALNGDGLPDLLEKIRHLILWDQQPIKTSPRVFRRVREIIQLMRSGQRSTVLPVIISQKNWRDEVAAGMETGMNFTEDDLTAAIKNLEQHGHISLLQEADSSQVVLLQPKLLNNLAASIVLQARAHPKGLGAVSVKELTTDDGRHFRELQGLSPWERQQLIGGAVTRFLSQSICFQTQLGEDTYLIFPALINEKQPTTDILSLEKGYSYVISGAVENIFASLVVLLGNTNLFTRTGQWRHHAQYELDLGEVVGFTLEKETPNTMEIVLHFAPQTRKGSRQLFASLLERFLQQQAADVRRYSPLICDQCNYPANRDVVRQLLAEGNASIFCSKCGHTLPLASVSEATPLTPSQTEQVREHGQNAHQRSQYVAALFQLQQLRGDRSKKSCFISYAWGDEADMAWVRKRLADDLHGAEIDVLLDVWHNADIDNSIPRYVDRIPESNFTIIVGTPAYMQKYNDPTRHFVVKMEMDAIHSLWTTTPGWVLPVLRKGALEESLPVLARSRIYADFRNDDLYFANLFNLVRTIYGVPSDKAAHLLEQLHAKGPHTPWV